MTHARRWRDAAILVLVLGLLSAWAFFRTSPAEGQLGWGQGALLLVATNGLWALLALPFVQRTLLADTRLRKGDDALARWAVTPTDWNRFVIAERERSAVPGAPANLVSTSRRVPPEGLEVIIGRDAIIVGDEYHPLRALGRLGPAGPAWVSLPLPALQYHVAVTDATDTLVDRVIRVPVAQSAQAAARALATG
jgi:hypothetical protein